MLMHFLNMINKMQNSGLQPASCPIKGESEKDVH